MKIFDPVMPIYVKRKNYKIMNHPPYKTEIGDNIDGLFNYFTTSTVRFKV